MSKIAEALLALAALLAVLVALIGKRVTHDPPVRIDARRKAPGPRSIGVAIVLTNSGYAVALTVLAIVSIGGAWLRSGPLTIPIAIVLLQLASQAIVALIKRVFARPRPRDWRYRREAGSSFPSGHATTAIVFYGAWLVETLLAPLPLAVRALAGSALTVWMVGIGWSRIVLGAHYVTDVLGGYLFGVAWLCAAVAAALLLHDAGFGPWHP